MFLENQAFPENKIVDERISRAIDNDHTAAMKAPIDNKKHKKKGGSYNDNMITVCMLCQKAFKNPLFYRKHLRLHADKSHHCHLCGKNFLKKHHLQSHLQTHAKHQFQCPICHKRFTQKGHLNQHVKFHATKKIFKCSICDKDFFQQEHLKTHLRHHNNERPFECDLCQKSFNIKSSLQRHMNCHTGEKPFICGICNRGYTRRSVLMLHIQQVHENKKPFQCDECHLCFSQKGNLQAHFRRKHLQPKSELKRGKDKDGKIKRSIKRPHSRPKAVKIISNKNFAAHLNHHHEDPSKSKLNKSKLDNTSLHSYASKVKAIVNRGARAQASENQRIVNKYSKSAFAHENGKRKEQSNSQSAYNSTSSLDTSSSSSSCSLSDEAVDIGCNSSGGEDIPELNFPNILENHADVSYDIKSLSDFDNFFDGNKGWEEYLMPDADNILSSSLIPHYEMSDVFNSPTKPNVLLPKSTVYGSDETLGWTDDYTNPLFTAEDLDEIKDISSGICGLNSIQASVDGIKLEPCEQDKRIRNGQISRGVNHLSFNIHKGHLAGSSMQA